LSDRTSPIQSNFPIPEDFVRLAVRIKPNAINIMLNFVWQGYDRLREGDRFTISKDDAHPEDTITLALHHRIQDVMDPFSPFQIIHQPLESEQQKPTGRPPQSDLGFRLTGGNTRSHFTIEAKVIRTDGAVSEYVKEIRDNFLTGRYSTFSSEAAMLGYLLSGTAERAFDNIAAATSWKMTEAASFTDRDYRCSSHMRTFKNQATMPSSFLCHHLLLSFV
jgi:hypothetical protein